jgi:3-oxoacyl-[acyl-carrier protein] reductase
MKHALVTGASGDIGKEICLMLAKHGYLLYLHYNKNVERGKALQKELEELFQVQSILVHADLSKPDGPAKLMDQISSPVDVLIYNCGHTHYGLLTDFTEESIAQTIQLNLISAISLTKRVIPSMIAKRNGKIIMISSVWGEVGAACETVYSGAKGGLNSFVKAISKELAPSQIQVNCVSPGIIDTQMLDCFSESELEELKADIPAGRFGQPNEVAHAVEFLLSEKASYISGHVLSLNGSWFT